jgi:hypothetical protein
MPTTVGSGHVATFRSISASAPKRTPARIAGSHRVSTRSSSAGFRGGYRFSVRDSLRASIERPRSLPRIKLLLSFSCHDSTPVTMGVAGPGWWGCGAQKILLSFGVRRSLSCVCGVRFPGSGGSIVRRLARQREVVRRFPAGRSVLPGFGPAGDRVPIPRRGGQSGRARYCRRGDGARGTRRRGDRIRGGARGTRGGAGRRDRLGRRQCCRGRQCRRRRRLAAGALRHRLRPMHGRQGQSGRGTARPRPGLSLSAAGLRLLRSDLVAARPSDRTLGETAADFR